MGHRRVNEGQKHLLRFDLVIKDLIRDVDNLDQELIRVDQAFLAAGDFLL